jgi:signal transduction histidine kinase
MGVTIARKVTQNHGGYLWAESDADDGTTFKLLLRTEFEN